MGDGCAARAERQLALDLTREPSFAADDFLLSASNVEAFTMIERWPDWPDRVLLLVGAAGTGKSHLGAIWSTLAHAATIRSDANLQAALHGPPLALVEDCDRARLSEQHLFHLLNAAKENRGWLLVTARELPDVWGVATPDLLSRLRLAPTVTIKQPDAALLRAVLVKLFSDRQIRVDEDVVHYAALHCEQSIDAIRSFVAAVDSAALAAGRRITRPLAAATIERLAVGRLEDDEA